MVRQKIDIGKTEHLPFVNDLCMVRQRNGKTEKCTLKQYISSFFNSGYQRIEE